MSDLVLVDTSAWTHALRRTGDPEIRARVHRLLSAGNAAWCDAVRLELWKGSSGEQERARLLFACAKVHGVQVEHQDQHYDLLAALP